MRLTNPQRKLLIELRETPSRVFDGYLPLKALLRLGLVESVTVFSRFGDGCKYRATEAGKKFAEELEAKK
jgi:hypothetical protein